MVIPAIILTVDNISEVAEKTSKSHSELVKLLIDFNADNIYPVKVPLPIPPIWRTL